MVDAIKEFNKEKSRILNIGIDTHIPDNQEDYIPFSYKTPDNTVESIVYTKYFNSKHALDLAKVDFEYLSRQGISLHDYIDNALNDYIMALYIRREYDLKRLF